MDAAKRVKIPVVHKTRSIKTKIELLRESFVGLYLAPRICSNKKNVK